VVMELRAPHGVIGDTRARRKQIEAGRDNSRLSSHTSPASLCTWITRPEFVQLHIVALDASLRPVDRVSLLRSGECGLGIDAPLRSGDSVRCRNLYRGIDAVVSHASLWAARTTIESRVCSSNL
jgi:hypothetical protein